ncbi:MAG: hypothetical protein LBV67_12325 [Streptococcaceae bacterium]|jgi:hypothetical protein|nr:hypothetical protein [Streptococcaceae bacterium]
MKKIVALLCFFFILTGCAHNIDDDSGFESQNPINVQFNYRNFCTENDVDSWLGELDANYFEVDFKDMSYSSNMTLVIWTETPMENVSLIEIGNNEDNEQYLHRVLFDIPDLETNQFLVIHNWVEFGCTQTRSGIMFIDENGFERAFAFGLSNWHGGLTFNEIIFP